MADETVSAGAGEDQGTYPAKLLAAWVAQRNLEAKACQRCVWEQRNSFDLLSGDRISGPASDHSSKCW